MGLRVYTAFMAFFTFFLVIAGAMVTSTGSALAVPDWPLSFGQVFPKMEGGVFYEHGHRMIAATVGILTIVLAVWLWRRADESLLRVSGWIALGMVCAQGILGGITVLLRLPAVTSVGHACLGQLFFSWICCIAAMVWSDPGVRPQGQQGGQTPDVSKLRRLALMTTGFVILQLIFGAIYRHTGTMLHVHFLGAALVFIHVILLWRRVESGVRPERQTTGARPPSGVAGGSDPIVFASKLLGALVFAQVGLGISAWQHPTILDATAHVAVGALILAVSSVISLETFRRVTV